MDDSPETVYGPGGQVKGGFQDKKTCDRGIN